MRRLKGLVVDCLGLASVQATTSGIILTSTARKFRHCAVTGWRWCASHRLPGEVPARLPGQAFWDKQGFQFEAFPPAGDGCRQTAAAYSS